MKRASLILLVAVTVLLCGAGQAKADTITYIETATATGTIGATSFSDVFVAIAFTGDTSNVNLFAPGILVNSVGTGKVRIGAIGTFVFTDALESFVNQVTGGAGIIDISVGSDVLDTFNPTFAAYNLASGIGPISGFPSSFLFDPLISFGTTGGSLHLTDIEMGTPTTFTATITTPEPCSLLLMGTGLAGLAIARRQRLA